METSEAKKRLELAARQLQELEAMICPTLIRQQAAVHELLVTLAAAGHVWVEGLSGMSKILLVRLVTGDHVGDALRISSVERLLEPAEVLELQPVVAGQGIDDSVLDHAVRIVPTTRDWQGIETGAGPPASITLVRAARAHGLLSGNGFVTPDDVKSMAPSVLRHRLELSADLEIEGYRPDDVLADVAATRA